MRHPDAILNSLARHSQRPFYHYHRLYRNLFRENLFFQAYQRIYAKPGNMTPGTDGETIDATSMQRIRGLIQTLRDETYSPHPSRRIYISKANGKTRPLGIPSFQDKLVQEVVRMLLEAIFEPGFEDNSHGFRPRKSCHTALKQVQNRFTGVKWFVEGDIESFFDRIDHQTLIGILRERIRDERFLRLIHKFLKAGYVENRSLRPTYSGTPQGGIIALLTQSPTLSLIFNLKLSVVSFRSVVLYFIKSIIFVKYEKVRELGISSTHQSCVHFAVSTDSFWRCTGRVDAFVWRVSNTGLPLCPTSPRAAGAVTYSGKNGSLHSKTASQPDRSGEIFCCFPWLFHQQSSPGCPGGLFSQARLWKKRRRSLICRSAMIDFGNGSLPRFTGFWFHRLGLSLLPMPARKG